MLGIGKRPRLTYAKPEFRIVVWLAGRCEAARSRPLGQHLCPILLVPAPYLIYKNPVFFAL
jgi:hypothetical protein